MEINNGSPIEGASKGNTDPLKKQGKLNNAWTMRHLHSDKPKITKISKENLGNQSEKTAKESQITSKVDKNTPESVNTPKIESLRQATLNPHRGENSREGDTDSNTAKEEGYLPFNLSPGTFAGAAVRSIPKEIKDGLYVRNWSKTDIETHLSAVSESIPKNNVFGEGLDIVIESDFIIDGEVDYLSLLNPINFASDQSEVTESQTEEFQEVEEDSISEERKIDQSSTQKQKEGVSEKGIQRPGALDKVSQLQNLSDISTPDVFYRRGDENVAVDWITAINDPIVRNKMQNNECGFCFGDGTAFAPMGSNIDLDLPFVVHENASEELKKQFNERRFITPTEIGYIEIADWNKFIRQDTIDFLQSGPLPKGANDKQSSITTSKSSEEIYKAHESVIREFLRSIGPFLLRNYYSLTKDVLEAFKNKLRDSLLLERFLKEIKVVDENKNVIQAEDAKFEKLLSLMYQLIINDQISHDELKQLLENRNRSSENMGRLIDDFFKLLRGEYGFTESDQ